MLVVPVWSIFYMREKYNIAEKIAENDRSMVPSTVGILILVVVFNWMIWKQPKLETGWLGRDDICLAALAVVQHVPSQFVAIRTTNKKEALLEVERGDNNVELHTCRPHRNNTVALVSWGGDSRYVSFSLPIEKTNSFEMLEVTSRGVLVSVDPQIVHFERVSGESRKAVFQYNVLVE